jgi:3-oxoacyl-[acyl-carrier protein] reductase
LSKSLAIEYAKKNIRVNCISPGFIDTKMIKSINEEFKKKLIENIPMKKLGNGNDIANCAIFLASDLSSYITGETIHVNGGMYMA